MKKHKKYEVYEMFEHVTVKRNGLKGQIVDIIHGKNGIEYTVESDIMGWRDDADYPSEWPLYFCREDEIEKQ